MNKLRSDIILDNARYTRIYHSKFIQCDLQNGKSYSFNKGFDNGCYHYFISHLNNSDMQKIRQITCGDIFDKSVNAQAWIDKKFGNLITINKALYYFCYFMSIGTYEYMLNKVPESVSLNAIRIALRIWLGHEALDFALDPRGIIPVDMEYRISNRINAIMTFVCGHEFAHHILGHCDKAKTVSMCYLHSDYKVRVLNLSQKEEVEADKNSIGLPNYSDKEYEALLSSTILWFLFLDIAEYASECINPDLYTGYQTHPCACDRMSSILSNCRKCVNKSLYNNIFSWNQFFRKLVKKDIDENYGEIYDGIYGSLYLSEPNTKRRGKQLIDRIDY